MKTFEPVQINVRSSGSAEPALDHVAAAFQAATGHRVKVAYSAEIDNCDVVVASRDALERKYGPAGKVENGAIVLGSIGLGLAIRPGLPVPDISTLEKLKAVLLDADRIVLTKDHTSGLYIESMLKQVGVYDAVSAKIEHAGNGPLLMQRLLEGEGVEIAFLSTNAIKTFRDRGLVLAGVLPKEVQLVREFAAVPSATSDNKQIAREFVQFCAGPGRAILVEHGFA